MEALHLVGIERAAVPALRQFDGPLEHGRRFPRPVESEEGPPQVMQGVGAGGLRLDGDLQRGQRLLETPGINKHHSQVQGVHRILRRDAAFLPETVDGQLDGVPAAVQELHGPQVETSPRHEWFSFDGPFERLAGPVVLPVVAIGPADQNPGLRNRTLLGHLLQELLGGLGTLQEEVAAREGKSGFQVFGHRCHSSLQLLHRELRLAACVEGPRQEPHGTAISRAAREQTPQVVRRAFGLPAFEREFGQGEQRAPRFEGRDQCPLVSRLRIGRGARGALKVTEQ